MFARVFNKSVAVELPAAEPKRRRAYRLLAANPVPWEPRRRRWRWRRAFFFFVEAIEWAFSARIVRHVAPGVRPQERWEFEDEGVKLNLRNF